MKKSKELGVAIKAARKAGTILMKHYGKLKSVQYKKYQDMVTVADKQAEKAIIEIIKKDYPEHSIYGEETGRHMKKSDYLWVIDPLDGTTNFVMQVPFFNTAISLSYKNEVVAAVVLSHFSKELFYAEKGKGAYLNGRRIHVSDKKNLKYCVCTFCHANSQKALRKWVRIYKRTRLSKVRHFRQMGSAQLELSYVACGRVESYQALELNIYDVAAGSLLIREAGGKVTDFAGKKWTSKSKDILASNGKIHSKLLKLINKK